MKISWKWIVLIAILVAVMLIGGNIYMQQSDNPVPDNPSKIEVEDASP